MKRENDRNDRGREVGSRSPASREAQEQGLAGSRSARTPEQDSQPAQASGRSGGGHRQEPEIRRSFPEGQAPSEQGEKEHPSPHVIARQQQGIGSQSGSRAGGTDSEEQAQRGEPSGEHARHGRQKVPGSGDATGDRPA